MTKQFRQFISINGIPKQLEDDTRINHLTLEIEDLDFGRIMIKNDGTLLLSQAAGKRLSEFLLSHGIHSKINVTECRRYKKICGLQARKIRGNLMYIVEDDSELEVLRKTNEVTQELNRLGVQYNEVCKWFCLTPDKKIRNQKIDTKIGGKT